MMKLILITNLYLIITKNVSQGDKLGEGQIITLSTYYFLMY